MSRGQEPVKVAGGDHLCSGMVGEHIMMIFKVPLYILRHAPWNQIHGTGNTPRKEDAGWNGELLGGSGKRCAGEEKTWQRMAFEAPLYHLFDPNS